MNIDELESLIDSEMAETPNYEGETEAEIINGSPLPPNISNTGEQLDSVEELTRVVSGLRTGNIHIVEIGTSDEHGVSVIILENNDGGRHSYHVNLTWRTLMTANAETYAVSQGAAVTPNSPSLEMDMTTSRFSGAIWYDKIKEQEIILAGLGGIGSYVAYLLGRMKPASLILYDPDKVEVANMSGQLYSRKNIGMDKVVAMRYMLLDYCEYAACCFARRYNEESATRPIMICGFDNMEARRIFYNNWKRKVLGSTDKSNFLFIDGRIKC